MKSSTEVSLENWTINFSKGNEVSDLMCFAVLFTTAKI